MPDPKHTVESILAFLHAPRTTVSAELIALAADYSDMCREANFRLRRCMDFLREGLRGEAVEYAATRPPLLDMIASLDFREFGEWDRICGTMGLARPGRVGVELARYLDDARKKHEPLRELLSKYRFLALSRSPLGERLLVVRQLFALDPTSTCWKREIEELERARIVTLRNEATIAIAASDLPSADKLLAELRAGPWLTPVPPELKEMLSQFSNSLHQASAIEQLRAMIPAVREAFASMSYEECRLAFSRWGKVVKDAKLVVPPDLRQEILPLAHWIDEQEQRQEKTRDFKLACDELAAALDADPSIEQLTELYREALGFDMDIPPQLLSAYRVGLEAIRRDQRMEKRKQFALGVTLVGVIVAALLVMMYVMLRNPAR